MQNNIPRLYKFLLSNREHCIALQTKHREANLFNFSTVSEKVIALLHDSFYTQSSPNLDKAQAFFKKTYANSDQLKSFRQMCKFFGEFNEHSPYKSLFERLSKEPGWGPKTTALFIKNIYHIHHLPQMKHLRFWEDVPPLKDTDELYLPVDAVIKDIMSRYDENLDSYWDINNFLREYGRMDVWDDLWFWGFFTQKGGRGKRELGFNEGKYWLQLHTPKEPSRISDIRKKCEEFVQLLPKG